MTGLKRSLPPVIPLGIPGIAAISGIERSEIPALMAASGENEGFSARFRQHDNNPESYPHRALVTRGACGRAQLYRARATADRYAPSLVAQPLKVLALLRRHTSQRENRHVGRSIQHWFAVLEISVPTALTCEEIASQLDKGGRPRPLPLPRRPPDLEKRHSLDPA